MYTGSERRKENLDMESRMAVMESRMAVMESKISTFKEEKSELDNDFKDLTAQINALNIQIPGLISGIQALTNRINLHETNAEMRGEEVKKHKIQCGNISTNVHNLWVVIGFIFTIIGILIVLMFKAK